jgi:hypothetical protein
MTDTPDPTPDPPDLEPDPGVVPDDDDTTSWPDPADDPAAEPTADTTGMGDPGQADSEGGDDG